jgi:HD-like signal output (HDOD) protein
MRMRSAEHDGDERGTAVEASFGHVHEEEPSASSLIREALETGLKFPRLPEVAVALAELATREGGDLREAEIVVSRDPSVAAKIVTLANSPSMNSGPPIRSLGSAIARLGLPAVRDAAFLVAAQTRVFRAAGYGERMEVLFEAAKLSGLVAREVCFQIGIPAEHAYLCGLLHDSGESIVLSATGDPKRPRGKGSPKEEVEAAVGAFHAEVGARACADWLLPSAIVDAVRYHHTPVEFKDSSKLAAVVAVVDVLLRHVGVGGEAKPLTRESEPIFRALSLAPEQVRTLAVFAERIALAESTTI